jgi:hypothetical protein
MSSMHWDQKAIHVNSPPFDENQMLMMGWHVNQFLKERIEMASFLVSGPLFCSFREDKQEK